MSRDFLSLIRTTLAAMILLPLFSCTRNPLPSETEKALDRLDKAVERHAGNVRAKGEELKHMTLVADAAPGRERYDAYLKMRTLYLTFDLDSAIHYGRLACQEADRIGDREMMALARMNLARLYIARGQLQDASPEVYAALPDTGLRSVRDCYLRVLVDIDQVSSRSPVRHYRDMMDVLTPDDEGWWYYMYQLLMATGRYTSADSLLRTVQPAANASDRDRAIHSILNSEVHIALGDTLRAVNELIQSSLHDLAVPVRDYKSLYRLSALLLKLGETDRAYRYINLALRDAEASKVTANRLETNRLVPDILTAHEQKARAEKRAQQAMFFGIVVLSLILTAALAFVMKQRDKLRRISRSERDLNSRLKSTNEELRLLNSRLEESNKVRDAYLLQYIQLSSEFVHDIEQLKIGISTAFHSKGMDGVNRYLAKIDDRKETRRFHTNFDNTFLALYPGFVNSVNSLLKPECQMSLGRDGSMSTELRVIALIYLGITDSDNIARFLHKSVSTVYNCRVRIRNGAIDGRTGFTSRLHEVM